MFKKNTSILEKIKIFKKIFKALIMANRLRIKKINKKKRFLDGAE